MTTSSLFSSPEWTPLDDSDKEFLSGGEVELSVEFVSDFGVKASVCGIPESARRKKRGVDICGCCSG